MTEEEQKLGATEEEASSRTAAGENPSESTAEEALPAESIETGADGPEHEPALTRPSAGTTARSGTLIPMVAVLLSIIALAISGYLWWQIMQGESTTTRRTTEIRNAVDELGEKQRTLSKELENSREYSNGERLQLTGRLDELSGLGPRLKTAEQAIRSLSGSSLSARQAWLEAEAAYLMQIANTRLRLAQDIDTSVAALEAADERLRVLSQPRLLEVRDHVASEIQALRALPKLDTAGVALKLGALASDVDRFPLKNALPGIQDDGQEVPQQEAGWDRAKAVVSGALKNMVSVRRADEAILPLLAPKDEFLLRRNLELQLLTARLAAVKADSGNYSQSLHEAKRWLNDYFDTENTAVAAAIDTIAALETEKVELDMPDISGSLNRLRQLTIRGE